MIWIADGFIPRYFPIKIYFFRFINLEVQSQQNEKFKNSQILTKKFLIFQPELCWSTSSGRILVAPGPNGMAHTQVGSDR